MVVSCLCHDDPTPHMSHIPQYTIQNRNVYISVLNGVLWDMGHVFFGIFVRLVDYIWHH